MTETKDDPLETFRIPALRRVYERWQAFDAQMRPWAHAWRAQLPVLNAALVGCTVEGLEVVDGAWDAGGGSHGLQVKLRKPDGHTVTLHMDASDAVGGPQADGPTANSDDDWLEQQAALGVSLSVSLYDEHLDPALREGLPPEGWSCDGDLEFLLPSVDPWWSGPMCRAVSREQQRLAEAPDNTPAGDDRHA